MPEDYDEGEGEEDWISDEDSDAELEDIANLELEFPLEDARKAGKREYLQKCADLGIVPIALFVAKMEVEHINLNHHGMGVKGAVAVSECLKVNDKIRSLNLGDNWLGDQGCAAMAEVLGVNQTLTSLSLSSNRIGLPGAHALAKKIRVNGSLAELNLRSNRLDDRAAIQLAASIATSTSLTRLDLSYNHFGEEAGKAFGEMLTSNNSLLELSLRWNGLGKKGGSQLAEGLRRNYLLNQLDLSWNGLGDLGSKTISEVLSENSSLTHLDISHNSINMDGALALAEGIEGNKSLLELELGFNPMGMTQKKVAQQDLTGLEAIVRAIRLKEHLSSVGMTEVQEGASVARGRASRFDPANPAGHYILDISRAWDLFLAEKLWSRMLEQKGETWANVTLDSSKVHVHGEDGSVTWQLPTKGVLEFDYVDWTLGLENSFRFDLSLPSDHMIATKLLDRAALTEGEAATSTRLNDVPFSFGGAEALPTSGILKLVYVVTRPIDRLGIGVDLDLGVLAERDMCLELWKRELTTSLEMWKAVQLQRPEGGEGEFAALSRDKAWIFPEVPDGGRLRFEYTVILSAKRQERGIYFSPPMDSFKFKRLGETLAIESLSDFERWSLIKMAAAVNYFSSRQAKILVEAMNYRKGKLDAAILLFSRSIDPAQYGEFVMESLGTDADRQALMDAIHPPDTGERD
jgi:hypothetical protein